MRPNNTAALVNSSVSLSCSIFPANTTDVAFDRVILWKRFLVESGREELVFHGNRLSHNNVGRMNVSMEENETSKTLVLTIYRVQHSDAGRYMCTMASANLVVSALLIVLGESISIYLRFIDKYS
jgi:hypothetical protein